MSSEHIVFVSVENSAVKANMEAKGDSFPLGHS